MNADENQRSSCRAS